MYVYVCVYTTGHRPGILVKRRHLTSGCHTRKDPGRYRYNVATKISQTYSTWWLNQRIPKILVKLVGRGEHENNSNHRLDMYQNVCIKASKKQCLPLWVRLLYQTPVPRMNASLVTDFARCFLDF